jgi:hypothetical protein
MRSDINNGIVAGLLGGVFFGIMMQMMTAPTPEGGQMPMMVMVAKVVRSDSMAVGWLYHLFNSAEGWDSDADAGGRGAMGKGNWCWRRLQPRRD